MLGTKDEAYLIIFEITDHAYFPYLSSLLIKDLRSTFSDVIFIFLLKEFLLQLFEKDHFLAIL